MLGELADLVAASYPKTRLVDMVLAKPARPALERVIVEYRQQAKLRSHGLSARRKLLLVGPPGCGKTMPASDPFPHLLVTGRFSTEKYTYAGPIPIGEVRLPVRDRASHGSSLRQQLEQARQENEQTRGVSTTADQPARIILEIHSEPDFELALDGLEPRSQGGYEKQFGLSKTTLERDLNAVRRRGLIRFDGEKSTGRWHRV